MSQNRHKAPKLTHRARTEDRTPEEQEAFELRQKLLAEQEVEDFRQLMSLPWGRRFMWRLLSECGVFRTSFTGNSETFFNEGMRNVGLRYLSDINLHCPGEYLRMVQEANEQEESSND